MEEGTHCGLAGQADPNQSLCLADEETVYRGRQELGLRPVSCMPRNIHTYMWAETTQHPVLPVSGFTSPLKERGECAPGSTHMSSLFVPPYPSPSLLRLITAPPSSAPPPPKYQLTGYPGNSAGKLPVTVATQHGHQAALHRKVRGPTRLLSSCDVAGRIGPGL